MVEVGSLWALVRATRGDASVLLLTFSITVAFDLVASVVVGLGVAIIIALRSVFRSARVELVPLESGDHSAEEHQLLSEHVVAYRLDRPLFSAAAYQFLLELTEIADVRVWILRMSRISTVDATGAKVLGDATSKLERRGIVVLMSGISPGHDEVLASLGTGRHLRENGRIFANTPEAINYAKRIVMATPA